MTIVNIEEYKINKAGIGSVLGLCDTPHFKFCYIDKRKKVITPVGGLRSCKEGMAQDCFERTLGGYPPIDGMILYTSQKRIKSYIANMPGTGFWRYSTIFKFGEGHLILLEAPPRVLQSPFGIQLYVMLARALTAPCFVGDGASESAFQIKLPRLENMLQFTSTLRNIPWGLLTRLIFSEHYRRFLYIPNKGDPTQASLVYGSSGPMSMSFYLSNKGNVTKLVNSLGRDKCHLLLQQISLLKDAIKDFYDGAE